MSAQVVLACSQHNNLQIGIYVVGILGLLMIISGAVIPQKKEEHYENEVEDNAIDILEKRYAKGEITKEEFDKMKKDLE